MQGLWLERGGLSFRQDCPKPVAAAGEALVRVRLAGICGTDLAMLQGYYPFTGIPGHEFVGTIVAAADRARLGQRVVGDINIACGRCSACRAARPKHCERRAVPGLKERHGAFAEYLTLPLANLHPVPPGVPDQAAVFAEPLAAALEIPRRIAIEPDHRVLLLGAGRLGQLIAQTLAATGCRLQVAARHPRQAELLNRHGLPCLSSDAIPSRQFDIVIEASGRPEGFVQARRALRPGGSLVLKSTYRGEVAVDLAGLVVDEITLIGSRCGSIPAALAAVATGTVDPAGLIDGYYPLDQGLTAFAEAARPGALKILLAAST